MSRRDAFTNQGRALNELQAEVRQLKQRVGSLENRLEVLNQKNLARIADQPDETQLTKAAIIELMKKLGMIR
jgi:hypothetical protein